MCKKAEKSTGFLRLLKFFLTELSKKGYTTSNLSATEYARKGNEEKSRLADRSQRAPVAGKGC